MSSPLHIISTKAQLKAQLNLIETTGQSVRYLKSIEFIDVVGKVALSNRTIWTGF